jgi:hypothetical protein
MPMCDCMPRLASLSLLTHLGFTARTQGCARRSMAREQLLLEGADGGGWIQQSLFCLRGASRCCAVGPCEAGEVAAACS